MSGEVDLFEYSLALELHKTLSELRTMPQSEYVGWISYFRKRQAEEGNNG